MMENDFYQLAKRRNSGFEKHYLKSWPKFSSQEKKPGK